MLCVECIVPPANHQLMDLMHACSKIPQLQVTKPKTNDQAKVNVSQNGVPRGVQWRCRSLPVHADREDFWCRKQTVALFAINIPMLFLKICCFVVILSSSLMMHFPCPF